MGRGRRALSHPGSEEARRRADRSLDHQGGCALEDRLLTRRAILLTGVSLLAGVAAWAAASRQLGSPLFPGPLQTLESLGELAKAGTLAADVGMSLQRIAIGFVLGCLVGIPLGLAMGLFRPVRVFCDPLVQFLRFVPPIAWLIPAIMWFGIGETSKVALIFYMTVFLVLLNTMAGVAAVPQNYVRNARACGASRWQLFGWVVFPATMSFSVAGARIALGNSFAAVVGAELIAAESGIGYRIVESSKWLAMNEMFAAILTLGVLGMAADRLVNRLTARWLARYLPAGAHV